MSCKSMKMSTNNDLSKLIKLEAEKEWRLEVESKSQVFLELEQGSAEIFGSPLVRDKKYVFPQGAKIAVFTWHGCMLKVSESTNFDYVSADTLMIIYTNIHSYLEEVRMQAEADGSKGPTVLICGRSSVGKSTLCRILLNYAVRRRKQPVFVDLDPGQGQISIPGTIGASLVERMADVEKGFSHPAPLLYHYGHTRPNKNIDLYMSLISRLAEVVNMQAGKDRRTSISGTIINTCGWLPEDGDNYIKHAINAFDVDLVLVLDQEILYYNLACELPENVKLLQIPKSGGVCPKSEKEYVDAQVNRIRECFYGLETPLYPWSQVIKFSDIKVYTIGESSVPESDLPLEMQVHNNRTKLFLVPMGTNLMYRVLSVSFASSIREVLEKNVAGFVCVNNVNMEKQTLTIITPHPRLPPGAVLLMSDVQYVD